MRILITNDDGINAPGLKTLTAIATELAGPTGEVWTVAPAFEQSGVGHCISYTHPTMLTQLNDRRFAAEGSPADCVLAGLYDVMKDGLPDLILSGVNRGNNAAENTLYSGTIGAAIEGALQGIPSIALSQFFGPANKDLDDPLLHRMSELLIERETLDAEEIAAVIRGEELPPLEVKKMLEARLASEGPLESPDEAIAVAADGVPSDATSAAIASASPASAEGADEKEQPNG